MKKFVSNIKAWFKSVNTIVAKKRATPNWKRLVSRKGYSKALEMRIIARVENDLLKGDFRKAIDRYEGFFQLNSGNQNIHNKVAELYLELGDKIRAGRHFFFKENPSELEYDCIDQFKKSCGHSPTIILKKLIYKEHYRIKQLDNYTKLRLKDLINEATIESEITPNFLKGLKRYFDKKKAYNKMQIS